MRVDRMVKKIKEGGLDEQLDVLYREHCVSAERYTRLCQKFQKYYGDGEVRLFSAPGRTELGGNHTDHEHGRVLAASVSTDIIACVELTGDNRVCVKSENYNENIVELSDLSPRKDENGTSNAIIRGICAEMKKRGYNIGGFKAYTVSDVPKGSGLSSSAAFEVLVITVMDICFNGGVISPLEKAAIGQYAESAYFGKPCGMLDQAACASGGAVFIDFKNPRKPYSEKIDFDFESSGYTVFTVNTGGNHSGLTADYAAVNDECRAVARALGKEYLRDVDENEFYRSIAALRVKCGDRAILRAMHIFDDDKRAEEQKNCLKKDDFAGYLKLVRESGDSSQKLLQNLYSISCPEQQGIPLAIALFDKTVGNDGAARVHGGGFAGTAQCYVPKAKADEFVKKTEEVFGKGSVTKIIIRPFGGTELV